MDRDIISLVFDQIRQNGGITVIKIQSRMPGYFGRELRQYEIEGIKTVGVLRDEPYQIVFHNTLPQMVQVILSIDGTNVQTGRKAILSPHTQMWVVRANSQMTLKAWPEDTEGGAELIFRDADLSVAAHTHGDLGALGYISAGVYVEGFALMQSFSLGAAKGGLESVTRGGPGTGAGDRVEQRVRKARGLTQPEFSHIEQVRYLWWEDLQSKLSGRYSQAGHPSGFAQPMADIGTTPRGRRRQSTRHTANFTRFK